MPFGTNQIPKNSQELKEVSERLYGNGNRLHYALVKVNGKQIGRSHKSTNPSGRVRVVAGGMSGRAGLAGRFPSEKIRDESEEFFEIHRRRPEAPEREEKVINRKMLGAPPPRPQASR